MEYKVFMEKVSLLKIGTLEGEYDEYNLSELRKDVGKKVAGALKAKTPCVILVKKCVGEKRETVAKIDIQF